MPFYAGNPAQGTMPKYWEYFIVSCGETIERQDRGVLLQRPAHRCSVRLQCGTSFKQCGPPKERSINLAHGLLLAASHR